MTTSKSTANRRARKTWREVLVLGKTKKHQKTIRKYFRQWREENDIPDRCDNPSCQFHTTPLSWNGKPLLPILDHREGNSHDNTPGSLRFLCPNCDSQLTTRGGANRGRVSEEVEGGYTLHNRDGTRIVSRSGVAFGVGTAFGVLEAVRNEPDA